MCRLSILLLHVVFVTAAFADCWVWEGGSENVGLTQKNAAPSAPSARCCSQSWTTGKTLWLFGGAGDSFIADLWRLDTSAKQTPVEWERIYRTTPNFGGNSSSPSARSYAVTWARTTQNGEDELWMWGGFGSAHAGDADGNFLADLWSYNVQSRAWTKHETTGAKPTPRNWMNFWPTKNGDEVWMHSGMAKGTPEHHYGTPLSDMWRLNLGSKKPTWTEVYEYPKHAGAIFNGTDENPGYRSNSYTTVSDNMLWLYGGEGGFTASNGSTLADGDFQDVWQFDIATLKWKHVSGPQTIDGLPKYGKKGTSSRAALPPAEHAGYIFRQPLNQALWFFGGENGSEVSGMRGDLWAYNLTNNEWTWRSGANHFNGSAHYGSVGVASAANVPAARYAGQGWVVGDRLWMFGGYGLDAKGNAGYLTDTWTYRL
jgi:hypothetical protein